MQKYELYHNGRLIEQYQGPTDATNEVRIGDGRIVWNEHKYTRCGNCDRVLLVGEGCGLC